MAQVFDNRMVAHVWAQQEQASGRSGNGNFFFEGQTLYSYGRHFAVGYFVPPELRAAGVENAPLINGDSYSISTTRHQSYARQATSYRGICVPGLTDLAKELSRAAHMGRGAVEAIHTHISQPKNWPGVSDAARLLELVGVPNSAKVATKIETRVIKTLEADRVAAAKEKADSQLRTGLQLLAYHGPKGASPIKSHVLALAARSGPTDTKRRLETIALDLFRGARVAKARRQTARARDMLALRKAACGLFAVLDGMALRGQVSQRWRALVRDVRKVTPAMVTNGESYPLQNACRAAEYLAEMAAAPGDYLAHVFRVLRINPADMADSITARAIELESMRAAASRVAERRNARDTLQKIRAARDELARPLESVPADQLAERATTLKAAEHSLWQMADSPPIYRGDVFRPGKVPARYRIAGFTGAYFLDLLTRVRQARELADRAAKVEQEAAKARDMEEARTSWRETGKAGDAATRLARRGSFRLICPDGGAMLRAVDVTRDDSGAITGGTLKTSQGADVPLTHALRAFALVRRVMARGQGWRANGHTIRVGHFRVDSISAEGVMHAGCHTIHAAEMERLAAALGVADMQPDDSALEPNRGAA